MNGCMNECWIMQHQVAEVTNKKRIEETWMTWRYRTTLRCTFVLFLFHCSTDFWWTLIKLSMLLCNFHSFVRSSFRFFCFTFDDLWEENLKRLKESWKNAAWKFQQPNIHNRIKRKFQSEKCLPLKCYSTIWSCACIFV